MRERNSFGTLCNTGDGVFIVDADKHIIRWNKGAERILGFSEPEILNLDCHHVISGSVLSDASICGENCRIHSGAIKGAPQKDFDILTQSINGAPLWLNVTTLSHSDSGEPFIVHIFRDITQEKRRVLALDQFLDILGSSGAMPKDVLIEKPMSRHAAPAKPSELEKPSAPLSAREIEVLTLLAEGLSTKGLAQKLNISHFTARNHIQNILVKLELHSKAQAVSYAFKKGIL